MYQELMSLQTKHASIQGERNLFLPMSYDKKKSRLFGSFFVSDLEWRDISAGLTVPNKARFS